MSQLHARFAKPLLAWTRGKNVRGVILINHILRCPPNGVWRMELFGASMHLSPFNERRRREFESFDNAFKIALCNPGTVQLGETE